MERGVHFLKDVLKKVNGPVNKELLDTITFRLNNHILTGECSASMRFLGRAARWKLPNSMIKTVNRDDLVKTRMKKQIKLAERKGRQSKDQFKEGDKVILRDLVTRHWSTEGLVVGEIPSGNIMPLSFVIELQSGNRTIRHMSHMRH